MAKKFTRQEFYDLAWSKPITHLAKEFRLSDVAVHKICRKHNIPTPPLGWWAKKQAGKPVKQTPLPRSSDAGRDTVSIASPEICVEPDMLAAARESARITATAEKPGAVINSPIIEATIAALVSANACYRGLLKVSGPGVISCEVGRASIPRLKRILQRLAVAAATQGFSLDGADHGARFVGNGETISILVTETFKRVKHMPTDKEAVAVAAWEKKRDRSWATNSWDFDCGNRPVVPEWDYVLSGHLGIELSRVYLLGERRPRSIFRDCRTQRLDDMASEIAVAVVVLAAAKTESSRRYRVAEEARRQAQLERERPYRLAHIATRRRHGLDEILDDMVRLEHFQKLIGNLQQSLGADEDCARVTEFLRWAEQELVDRENGLSRSGLERCFVENRLFGNDDDHDFQAPSSIWY